ncbi:MAG: zinc ribbon domain-containing protein [Oscillospiraceae bacterium]|nr:zinc ribbon domain-containing protein [Oscillospiraceae bacterium]
MFFMIGITDGSKDLSYSQLTNCPSCGRYSSMQVFVTYNQLILFFIPLLKFGKQYYVKMKCCGAVYALDSEIGKQIEAGAAPTILSEHLSYMYSGSDSAASYCSSCGRQLDPSFSFCPYCGRSR